MITSMMQDVHVNLNLGLPWKMQHSKKKEEGLFHQQIVLKF
jgi:hypothetical protein